MLETAVANLRFALSMGLGRPFHQPSLDKIYRAVRQTQEEFGSLGVEMSEVLSGPSLDDETRRFLQTRRFRKQATRGARETEYYAEVFGQLGIDPAKIDFEDIATIPLTTKDAVRDNPEAFIRRTAKFGSRSTTTGTTGWPTSIYFSHDEMRTMAALSSLSSLSRGLIAADDLVQINISTRATIGVRGVAAACDGIGAGLYICGLVSPEHTLKLLAERHRLPGKKERVSVMSTYPSYLGLLVETGRRLGYGPADFGLETILAGGEVLTAGLERRAKEFFGDPEIISNYGMTELAPLAGNHCEQGHLHFEVSMGLIEVASLEEPSQLAVDGEVGTIVATPFPPFRESTILLRYNTEDVVRHISGPLTCELRNLPATSGLLGKQRLSVRHDDGWTFLRDVVEALEEVDDVPLPARYGYWAVPGGVSVEVMVESNTADARRRIDDALHKRGVPVRGLRLVENYTDLEKPLRLRADMREGSFAHVPLPAPSTSHEPVLALTGPKGS
ncbi:MAG: AMP-binding protein [Actinomycetota bacterium]|nr:AMP-binding protein [Actinomycetota bacterium]